MKSNVFLEVRNRQGKLLFRYDPERELIEIKPHNGVQELVDLSQFQKRAIPPLPIDTGDKKE